MSNGKLQPLVVSAIGVASAIVGALLGHFFSLKEKRVSLLDDARRQAYVSFLDSREKPAEITSADADRENADAAALKAEKGNDRKIAKDLRVRASELDRKSETLHKQWDTKLKVAINDIAIYGDSRVVHALANFYRHPSSLPCDGQWALDIQIYKDMRHSLIPEEEPVSDKDLAELVLTCAVSDQR